MAAADRRPEFLIQAAQNGLMSRSGFLQVAANGTNYVIHCTNTAAETTPEVLSAPPALESLCN